MLHPASADDARDRNRALFGGAFGGVYSFYIEHERLCRLIAALVWGADSRPFYASMRRIGEVRQGGLIVDAPCGAGVAFRGLRPGHRVRYIALDLSARMLELARRRAVQKGLGQIEFVEGDAQAIPVEDGSVDLFLSYWGLHCFPDPARAAARPRAACAQGVAWSAARSPGVIRSATGCSSAPALVASDLPERLTTSSAGSGTPGSET